MKTLSRTTILGFVAIVGLAILLFVAKTEAESVGKHVTELEGQVEQARKDVRVLEDRLARLSSPSTMERAAREAGLVPVPAVQIVALGEIDAIAPLPVANAAPVPDEGTQPSSSAPELAAPQAATAATTDPERIR
jgi:hypothetical protein